MLSHPAFAFPSIPMEQQLKFWFSCQLRFESLRMRYLPHRAYVMREREAETFEFELFGILWGRRCIWQPKRPPETPRTLPAAWQ